MIHNGAEYRAADAHAHIYPEKIAEKATASVGAFYDLNMDNVGLPSVLLEQGGGAGIDRFAVCSVATKVEQVRSIALSRASAKNTRSSWDLGPGTRI